MEPSSERRRPPGFSALAILGTVALIVGSIGLGIYGPRMGQRGMRISGEPLSLLRNEAVRLYEAACKATQRDADENPAASADAAVASVFGTTVAVPDLSEEGCRLEGADELVVAGHRTVCLRYRQNGERFPVMILLVAEPHDLLHFDVLGRYLPLAPGVRVEEEIVWPNVFQVPPTGIVIQAVEGYALVLVASPPDRTESLERAILPVEPESSDEIEVVAGILEPGSRTGPM